MKARIGMHAALFTLSFLPLTVAFDVLVWPRIRSIR